MPQAAAAAVVSWLGVTGATAAFVSAVVYTVVTVAINYGLNRLAQALAGKPKRDDVGPQSRDVTIKGTVEPAQLIYGQVRTGGFIAFYGTSGTNNKYLHFVIVVAFHQCEAIDDLWLDSRHIPPSDIAADGTVNTAVFQDGGSKLTARRFLGTKAQTADSVLTAAFSGTWTSAHRGAGVAYVHYRLERSEKTYPTGSPNAFFALTKGRRLYDPRLDSTYGGSGTQRNNDATTWTWSQNVALAVRDYISGGSKWYDNATPEKRLCFGEADSRIDDAFTITAANICDEAVTIPLGVSTTTQPRYTCDVQISCGNTHRENLEILQSANVGTTAYVNGKYRIYAGAYDTPSVTLTEDDILGPVTVSTHPNGEDLYNFVTGTFYDENRDWQQCPFPSITNSSYETEDRGQKVRKIELHATRTSYRAQRIGILHLAQSRMKTTVRFDRLSPKAMAIAEHETFFANCSEFGWSNQVLRCREWEFLPDGFVALTARFESSSAYTDPSTATYADPQDATVATPEYDEPDTPLNFEARSMPEGILFRWNVAAPANSKTLFRLYEHSAQTPFSSATEVWSGIGRSVTLERSGYMIRYYWLVAELNGIQSAATPVGNGLAAAPSLQGFDETFHDSFEHQDYSRFYNLLAGTPTVTYPTNGENGGRVLRAQNMAWISWKKNIPYDPTSIYMLTVRARMFQAPSSSTRDNFYAGVTGIAADGETLIDNGGAATVGGHYCAAAGFDFGGVTLGDWVIFRGYISGHSATPPVGPNPSVASPMPLYGSGGTVVKFIRPMVILSDSAGDGIMEVDYIKLDRVVYSNAIAPDSASDPTVNVSPTDGSIAYSATTQPAIESSGIGGYASYTAPVNEPPAKVTASWTAQARISNTTSGAAVGEARLIARVFINGSLVHTRYLALEGYAGTQYGILSGEYSFEVPAGQLIEMYLTVGRSFSTGGASPAQTIFWRGASMSLAPFIR